MELSRHRAREVIHALPEPRTTPGRRAQRHQAHAAHHHGLHPDRRGGHLRTLRHGRHGRRRGHFLALRRRRGHLAVDAVRPDGPGPPARSGHARRAHAEHQGRHVLRMVAHPLAGHVAGLDGGCAARAADRGGAGAAFGAHPRPGAGVAGAGRRAAAASEHGGGPGPAAGPVQHRGAGGHLRRRCQRLARHLVAAAARTIRGTRRLQSGRRPGHGADRRHRAVARVVVRCSRC